MKSVEAPRYVPFRSQVFTVPESAEHLRVSRVTIYTLINAGRLKTIKIGTRTLITGSAIQEFLRSSAA